ncbi:MAG: ATP-grasp domain-containing protein [Candidatus Lokiarchaeota archaeon]|nr:ATP-grasp domain-containing protein [Candidatus Lokiarchaeota archaeon]
MSIKEDSVLVAGFNTRPLVYSLNRAGYEVYAVDFFGDLDLYPYVNDCLILTKKLNANYDLVKKNYSEYLPLLILELLEKYPGIKNLIIGSGLDNALDERALILKEISRKKFKILNLNNELGAIKKSRDIDFIFKFLIKGGFNVPRTISFDEFKSKINMLEYPIILKKKSGSGGTNVYKIQNYYALSYTLNLINRETFDPKDWLIQEYIEGNSVSCTTISNGIESKVISVNHQLVGDTYLNAPKEFMYCGNVVPAKIFEEEKKLIVDISLMLSIELGLKGINGFDFVLRNHYPFLMEINPRIPGSIRASEEAMNLNLLDLHIKSFTNKGWEYVKKTLNNAKIKNFVTKMIFFAPKEIDKILINKINDLEHIHDKSEPVKNIYKNEPVCTILFKATSFSDSYLGSLKVVDKIKKIIK